VGRAAIESMVAARRKLGPEKGVFEWAKSLDLRLVNKRVIESLAASGALDQFAGNRASKFAAADRVVDIANAHQRELASGQTSLFGEDGPGEAIVVTLEELPEWEAREILRREHELLGHYLSGHPLEEFRTEIARFASHSVADHLAGRTPEGDAFILAGLLTTRRNLTTKRGDPMCVIGFEDFSGVTEVIFFPEAYAACRDVLDAHDTLLVVGRRSNREGDHGVVADEVFPLEEAFRHLAERLHLRVARDAPLPFAAELRRLLISQRGSCPVTLSVETRHHGVVALPVRDLRVCPSAELDGLLAATEGVASVTWSRVPLSESGGSRGGGRGRGWGGGGGGGNGRGRR
jgi:DNA polymerase-3 subunit alpha